MTIKKRALWITSSFPKYEGDSTAPFLMEQAKGMVEAGWNVDVLTPHAPGLARQETIGAVRVYRYRYMWPTSWQKLFYGGGALGGLKKNIFKAVLVPIAMVALWLAIIGRVRSAKKEGTPYSLLHSHWIIPQALITGIASRLVGLPHFATGHGSDLSELRAVPLLWLKRRALGLTDFFHVVTPRLKELAEDFHTPVTPVVVPLGVDFSAGLQQKAGEVAEDAPLLCLGRLSPEKGVDVLISSLPYLNGEAAKRQLVIVGGGPEEGKLQQLVSDLGLEARVTFAGMVTAAEARAWIRRAAVMVIPSRHEGQGMVSMEAQAIGTPIVASEVGGLPDSLNGGAAARLVRPEDPKALAAAISDVFANPTVTAEKVQQGLDHVRQRFSLSVISRKMATHYDEAIIRFTRRRGR